jgi:hypothetical protein
MLLSGQRIVDRRTTGGARHHLRIAVRRDAEASNQVRATRIPRRAEFGAGGAVGEIVESRARSCLPTQFPASASSYPYTI